MTLPRFDRVSWHPAPLPDGIEREAQWAEQAAAGAAPAANLWCGTPGFVAPRHEAHRAGWAAAAAASAACGWPLQLRHSGGGLVPQGPGILNLSLVWRADVPQPIEAIYRALCDRIAAALARLDIAADTQAVEGSFCDGRYNLASAGRKLVGTAQAWRRIAAVPVVLAHALVFVAADFEALVARANAFETASGGARRYRAETMTSVERAWCDAHPGAPLPADLGERLARAIADRFGGSD